jgi:hypothetical protein
MPSRPKRSKKSTEAMFAKVLEASGLSVSDTDRLSPDLIEAVARLLWSERWAIGKRLVDSGLWCKQDDSVREPWRRVARRSLSLLFGLKVSHADRRSVVKVAGARGSGK